MRRRDIVIASSAIAAGGFALGLRGFRAVEPDQIRTLGVLMPLGSEDPQDKHVSRRFAEPLLSEAG
jgi:hypothetical protein